MENLNIILFGDWGYINDTTKQNMQLMKNINPDFYILLGDNFYPNGVKSVDDPQWKYKYKTIFSNDIPTFAVLGNHDYLNDVYAQIQYSNVNPSWKLPFFYYDMIIYLKSCMIHFIFIDSNILADDITILLLKNTNVNDISYRKYLNLCKQYEEKQKLWLEETLQKSEAKWKIVCGHYPIYSVGPHTISKKYQAYTTALFEKYGVDFYFSGHDHNMQHIFHKNTNYIVSGAFSSFYNKKHISNNFYKLNYVSQNSGFVKLNITDHQIEIEFIETNKGVVYKHLCSKL